MSITKINIELPDDVLYEIKSLPNSKMTTNEHLQLNMAIGMFASKSVSLAKAAEIAGVELNKFISILKELEIPAITYNLEMLADDLAFAKEE